LAHIRRNDFLINTFQTAIETIFFYHPAAWWLNAGIRREREHCCDDLVIRSGHTKTAYINTLANLEEWQLTRQAEAIALAGSGKNSLLVRIRRMVEPGFNTAGKEKLMTGLLLLAFVFTLGVYTRAFKEELMNPSTAGIEKVKIGTPALASIDRIPEEDTNEYRAQILQDTISEEEEEEQPDEEMEIEEEFEHELEIGEDMDFDFDFDVDMDMEDLQGLQLIGKNQFKIVRLGNADNPPVILQVAPDPEVEISQLIHPKAPIVRVPGILLQDFDEPVIVNGDTPTEEELAELREKVAQLKEELQEWKEEWMEEHEEMIIELRDAIELDELENMEELKHQIKIISRQLAHDIDIETEEIARELERSARELKRQARERERQHFRYQYHYDTRNFKDMIIEELEEDGYIDNENERVKIEWKNDKLKINGKTIRDQDQDKYTDLLDDQFDGAENVTIEFEID